MFSHGLFNCERNIKSLEKTLIKIIKNYKYIQLDILKNKIHSLKDFQIQMNDITQKKISK